MAIDPHDRAVAQYEAIKIILAGSLERQLDQRLYFPLYPSPTSDPVVSLKDLPEDPTPAADRLPGHLIHRLYDRYGPHVALDDDAWLLYRDHEAIDELFDLGAVSLFEAALMIDERIIPSEVGLVPDIHILFAQAVVQGDLVPRHPRTLDRYGLPPQGLVGAASPAHYGALPDLTWKLYPAELQRFAMGRWEKPVYSPEELAHLAQVPTAPDDLSPLVTPAPKPAQNKGRPPLPATENMFRALGVVLSGKKMWEKLGDQEQHPDILEAVLIEFANSSKNGPHSKYREAIQAFLNQFL